MVWYGLMTQDPMGHTAPVLQLVIFDLKVFEFRIFSENELARNFREKHVVYVFNFVKICKRKILLWLKPEMSGFS